MAINNQIISTRDLIWSYKNSDVILNKISFDLHEGEIVGIIGSNGCGKTTLLHILAGLLKAGVHGSLEGAFKVSLLNPNDPIGFVFQNYRDSLLPWRTVFGNIKAGRELIHAGHQDLYTSLDDKIVSERIHQFDLGSVQNKYPHEISGGQAQLTCIARALALGASLLIMDEPTSSLHYSIRNLVLDELLSERLKSNLTIIFSSHSLEEASLLSDRVVILSHPPSTVTAIKVSNMSIQRGTTSLGSPAHLDLYRDLLACTSENGKHVQ
jgi:NitT/TauT family transport system ATP-binding protein